VQFLSITIADTAFRNTAIVGWEEQVRTPSLLVAAWTISLAIPAVAQETIKCDGPEDACRKESEIAGKFSAAFNKNDAAALTSLYTQDAVQVGEGPILRGRDAIESNLRELFKGRGWSNHVAKVVEIHVVGGLAWRIGQWSVMGPGPNNTSQRYGGYFSTIDVPDNGTWKIHEETWNAIEAPPAAAGAPRKK
jgi:uncharacterized protein (TIGR02246 family)